MSFSFVARGVKRADVMVQVHAKMAEVVRNQPVHSQDRAPVVETCSTYLNLLSDAPDGYDYTLSVSGYLGWSGNVLGGEAPLGTANVSVTASHVRRDL